MMDVGEITEKFPFLYEWFKIVHSLTHNFCHRCFFFPEILLKLSFKIFSTVSLV